MKNQWHMTFPSMSHISIHWLMGCMNDHRYNKITKNGPIFFHFGKAPWEIDVYLCPTCVNRLFSCFLTTNIRYWYARKSHLMLHSICSQCSVFTSINYFHPTSPALSRNFHPASLPFPPSIPTKIRALISHFREHATTSWLTYYNKPTILAVYGVTVTR